MAKSTKKTSANAAKATQVKADVEDAVVVKENKAHPASKSKQSDAPAAPATSDAPVVQNVTVQKAGFMPTLAGGALAAGLGFAGAWLGFGHDASTDVSPQLADQASQIQDLEAQIAAIPAVPEMPEMPDLAPLEASIEDIRTESTTQLASLSETVGALEARITDVERAPTEEGNLTDTAITSIERELDGLRAEIAAQQSSMQEMTASAAAGIAAAREEAAADLADARAQTAAIEQEARSAAEAAQVQAEEALAVAAVAEVRIAMETGEPFSDVIANLETAGVAAPEALVAVAEDGLPTQQALADAFPDLARAALSTARSEGVDTQDGGGGLGSFLSSQFNVRSVEPREGSDTDAVLSRAEAAVGGGDLETAMTEVASLPDAAQSTFTEWLATAQARIDALAAVETLDSSVGK